jgi:hypothetical protein
LTALDNVETLIPSRFATCRSVTISSLIFESSYVA